MRGSVSPARSSGSLSEGSDGSSSAALSDVLANSQLASEGNSSPATSHGSRSSTEHHLEGDNSKYSNKWPGLAARKRPTAGDQTSEPDRAGLVHYDTVQLIQRLASLLHNLTKANDRLREPTKSPLTGWSSPTSGSPQPASSPELAQTTLARCTPQYSPASAWPEPSTSKDYFSLKTSSSQKRRSQSLSHLSSHANHSAASHCDCQETRESELTGAKIAYRSRNPTICFQARNIPAIGIEQYLLRIQKCWSSSLLLSQNSSRADPSLLSLFKDCPTTNEVYIALLVYFDRLTCIYASHASHSAPPFALDSYNVHRLLISGLAVGSKFLSDIFYTNSRYAKVGGLPLNEFNQLELQLLMLLDFHLDSPADQILRYANALLTPDEQAIRDCKPAVSPARPAMDDAEGSTSPGTPSFTRASSESGSSTIGGRSDCSSVCSTGTVVHQTSHSLSSSSNLGSSSSSSGVEDNSQSMDVDSSHEEP